MTTHSKDCMCHLCLPGQDNNEHSEECKDDKCKITIDKDLTGEELKTFARGRGTPSYHKEHLKELELLKDGQIVFKCLDCDVSIFLGQLNGFD